MENDIFMEELEQAADECMALHPGIGRQRWIEAMAMGYEAELVDALGADQAEVLSWLEQAWERRKSTRNSTHNKKPRAAYG